MPITPLNDHYLIEPAPPEQKRGSLFVLESNGDPVITGVVVATPAELAFEDDPEYPVIGDRVLFRRSSGVDIEHGGEQFRLVKLNELLGVVYDAPDLALVG